MRSLIVVLVLLHCSQVTHAQDINNLEAKIDELVTPLVNTNNYSGSILVAKNGQTQFVKAYGQMSREFDLDNKPDTKYFLASVSMIFTAVAIMNLIEEGKLSLNDPLSKFIPDYKNGSEITIHQMLSQRSGIPAIGHDGKVDYNKMTKFSQDTESLISYFKSYNLLFTPDAEYNHGRSDYILLAYIIEKLSGKSFGKYLEEDIFGPLGMHDSGHYKNEKEIISNLAKGYAAKDLFEVESASQIDWSSKTGHASIYSTVGDLKKFALAIMNNDFLTVDSWSKIFTDHGDQVGYGWFIRPHLDRKRYQMNGRSPGYSSYFGIYPDEKLSVIVLSNNYISLPADIGMSIAAMVLNEPFEPLNLSFRKLGINVAENFIGTYRFGESFYVPNYELEIKYDNGYLFSEWGGFIPIDHGKENIKKFILRTYWSSIEFVENNEGEIVEMNYDSHKGIKIDKAKNK